MPDIIKKIGKPSAARIGRKGSLVTVKFDSYIQELELNYQEAFRFAQAIYSQARDAEQKEKAFIPTKRDVDNLERGLCGNPTVIQKPPNSELSPPGRALNARLLAQGKPDEL